MACDKQYGMCVPGTISIEYFGNGSYKNTKGEMNRKIIAPEQTTCQYLTDDKKWKPCNPSIYEAAKMESVINQYTASGSLGIDSSKLKGMGCRALAYEMTVQC